MGLNTQIKSYLRPKDRRTISDLKPIVRFFVFLIAIFSLVASPYQPLVFAEVASNIEDLEECVYGDDICVDENIEKIKEAASGDGDEPVELSCEGSYGCDRMLDALSEAGGGIVRIWSPQTKGMNDQTFQALNKSEYYQASTCGESGGGGGGTLSGGGSGCGGSPEENKKQAWDYFIKKGLSESAAAGILGNAFKESTFNPAATNSQGCRGFVQWCGGRNTELDTFAQSKGKSWDCLELQLDYIWYEMMETKQASVTADGRSLGDIKLPDVLNGADFPDKALYSNSGKSGPYQAASMFHDYFERANTAAGEHLGRGEAAEDVYRDIVGKDPPSELEQGDSVAGADTTGSSGGGKCSSEGGSLSLECKALVEKFWQLVDEGKIELTDRARQEKDMQNCTEDPIECGTGGGKGGVNPYILKAFMEGAMAIQGDKPATVWSFNTGHDCDGLNHPKGKAVDIVCNGNAAGSGVGAEPHCNDMFKYFHEKYAELKLSELIWQYPPKEFSCNDGITLCNIGGHADHIHIGVNPDAGGNQ